MEKRQLTAAGSKFWITFASFVIIIAGLKAAAVIVTPFFLALVISAICLGPFMWLTDKGLPEWLSIIIITLSVLIISVLVILLIGSSIPGFVEKAPFYGEKLSLYWENINRWLVESGWLKEDTALVKSINPENIMILAGTVFSGLGNLMSNSILILLVIIFLLSEINLINKKIATIKPGSDKELNVIIQNIRKYFSTKTMTSLATGILIAVGLAIIGVDFPILWGFLAFILNYVPNIGSTIAAIPAVLLALVQLGPGSALVTTILYLVVNGVIGNGIEPRIMGKNLGLSTLVVFLSLIFWGWVLGTVGMLLAVPITMTIKLILDGNSNTRWIGILLGNESSINNYSQE